MGFQKGVSGNPKGRPHGVSRVAILEEALLAEGKASGTNPWSHVAKQFYKDNAVMIAVVKKFVPDSINIGIDQENNKIIVEFKH